MYIMCVCMYVYIYIYIHEIIKARNLSSHRHSTHGTCQNPRSMFQHVIIHLVAILLATQDHFHASRKAMRRNLARIWQDLARFGKLAASCALVFRALSI